MKRIILYLIVLLVFSFPVSAHGGRTDSNGGHTDQDTGEYHYHHGYPAHEHYDMNGDGILDCPYSFDDKTDKNNHKDSEHSNGYEDSKDYKNDKNSNSRPISTIGQFFGALFLLLSDATVVFFACLFVLMFLFNYITKHFNIVDIDKAEKTTVIFLIVALVIIYGLNLFGIMPFDPIFF